MAQQPESIQSAGTGNGFACLASRDSARNYPKSVLGVLLGVSGLELALVALDQTERTAATVMYATAAAILALGSTATGFAIGWVLALVVRTDRHSGSARDDS